MPPALRWKRDTQQDSPPDVDPILGGIEIKASHKAGIVKTQNSRIAKKTWEKHRNNIKNMIGWFDTNYPAYRHAGGIIKLTKEKLENPSLHFHKNTEDLDYEKINVDLVLAFLANHKILTGKKKAGKPRSNSDMKKFHHAILFGACEAKQALPLDYHVRVAEDFMKAYKKETVKLKQKGEMDSEDSDPIVFLLYRMICQWSLDSDNMFLWAFTLLQWNCMGRSISIDPLGLHNFKSATDSIKCLYDNSKSDQAGEKVSPKNMYANPVDPVICNFTGVGAWISLTRESFLDGSDSLFLGTGAIGTASHRYCEQLATLLSAHVDEVIKFCRVERARTHGIRKGGAIHATGGTTVPPPLPSVANRGEWSQGSVFDVYFLFAEPGDQYLGRCMAGLDPNSTDFAILPPHFTVGLDDDDVAEAMSMSFADIGDRFGCNGVLALYLASMVHNIDFFRGIAASNPLHAFNQLPILQASPDLIARLRNKITTDPSDRLSQPTGIPPHIQHAKVLKEVLKTTTDTLQNLADMADSIKEAIREAIEANDIRSGQVTMSVLENKLTSLKKEIVDAVESCIVSSGMKPAAKAREMPKPDLSDQHATKEGTYTMYYYPVPGVLQSCWHVPKGWAFPAKASLRNGFDFWVRGQPNNEYLDNNGELVSAPV